MQHRTFIYKKHALSNKEAVLVDKAFYDADNFFKKSPVFSIGTKFHLNNKPTYEVKGFEPPRRSKMIDRQIIKKKSLAYSSRQTMQTQKSSTSTKEARNASILENFQVKHLFNSFRSRIERLSQEKSVALDIPVQIRDKLEKQENSLLAGVKYRKSTRNMARHLCSKTGQTYNNLLINSFDKHKGKLEERAFYQEMKELSEFKKKSNWSVTLRGNHTKPIKSPKPENSLRKITFEMNDDQPERSKLFSEREGLATEPSETDLLVIGKNLLEEEFRRVQRRPGRKILYKNEDEIDQESAVDRIFARKY